MPNIFIDFWKDYFDKGAAKYRKGFTFTDLWGLLCAALSTSSVFADGLKTGLIDVFGINAAFIPLIVLLVTVFWSVYCIRAKTEEAQSGLIQNVANLTYSNPQYLRIIAKFLLPFIFVALILSSVKIYDQLSPLPKEIEGLVTNIADGKPVQNARVRIIAVDGNDVTQGESTTDQFGYYIIYTTTSQRKDAKLEVIIQGCGKPVSVSLLPSFLKETLIDHKRKKIYNHAIEINCK